MAEKLGIMICGHGSRNKMAADQFSSLAVGLKRLMPEHPVEYGYLEFANPVISHGLDSQREQLALMFEEELRKALFNRQ